MSQRLIRLSPPAALNGLRERLAGWRAQADQAWRQRSRREQVLLRLAGILLLTILPWLLLVRPALQDIRQAQAHLAALQADSVELQALILESRALRGHTRGRIGPDGLEQALTDSLQRAGLAEQAHWRLEPPDPQDTQPLPRFYVELAGADAAAALRWLAELPRTLSVRVLELDLQRSRQEGRERAGRVDGHLILAPQPPAGVRP